LFLFCFNLSVFLSVESTAVSLQRNLCLSQVVPTSFTKDVESRPFSNFALSSATFLPSSQTSSVASGFLKVCR
jgi:hypothetical protein